MPQPKKELDYSALNALLQFKVSIFFCADHLKVSKDTIMRRLKEDHALTFKEYHALQLEGTATKLQQKAVTLALEGDKTLLMFCLKNLAGWAEKQETSLAVSEIKIDKIEEGL